MIKIRMKLKFKRRGVLPERFRTMIRHTLMAQTIFNNRRFEREAFTCLVTFMQELNRKKILYIKFKNTLNRVMKVQKKFRRHIHLRQYKQAQLLKSISNGLSTIRIMFIKEKAYQSSFPGTLEHVNSLTSKQKGLINCIIQMFLDLPVYIHSINLLRWYGKFRNKGKYNTDLYCSLLIKIQTIKDFQAKLLRIGKPMLPSTQAIRHHSRMSFRRSITGSVTDVGSLFQKIIVKKEEKIRKRLALKHVVNLFTIALNHELPPILPANLHNADMKLNDEIILQHFFDIGIELEELSILEQPIFKSYQGYDNLDMQIIDLVYMALGYSKLKFSE